MKPIFCSIIGCAKLARHVARISMPALPAGTYNDMHTCDEHRAFASVLALPGAVEVAIAPFDQKAGKSA